MVKISFLISLLAGLSTLLGSFTIFLKKKDSFIPNSLLFSSGVMITVCLTDLLPNSFIKINETFLLIPTIIFMVLFILIGVVINLFIEYKTKQYDSLYKVGILSMIALIIHNIPEGIITFISSEINLKLGIILGITIALHNIPEGILISVPIYYSSNKRFKAIFYTFISGISEVVGALLGFIFFNNLSNNYTIGFIYSLISGLMLYIEVYEIPNYLINYENKGRVGYFMLGCIIILISHLIIK